MKTLLWVNACIRPDSRTERLCRRFLSAARPNYDILETRLDSMELHPLTADTLSQRDADIRCGGLDKPRYAAARAFAQADEIVVSAPYWDASFPSVLKVYFENICVNGITFAYGEGGSLVKLCRAEKLTYLTTCGGFLPPVPSVKLYMEELSTLFSIENTAFYAVPGLDIDPSKAESLLEAGLAEILAAELGAVSP